MFEFFQKEKDDGIQLALDMIMHFLDGTIERGVIRIPIEKKKDACKYHYIEMTAWAAIDYLCDVWDYSWEWLE